MALINETTELRAVLSNAKPTASRAKKSTTGALPRQHRVISRTFFGVPLGVPRPEGFRSLLPVRQTNCLSGGQKRERRGSYLLRFVAQPDAAGGDTAGSAPPVVADGGAGVILDRAFALDAHVRGARVRWDRGRRVRWATHATRAGVAARRSSASCSGPSSRRATRDGG